VSSDTVNRSQKYSADDALYHFLITVYKEKSEEEMRESGDGLPGQDNTEERVSR